jgi:hypothetical protein
MTQAREGGGVALAQVVDPNHISYSYISSEQDSEHWSALVNRFFQKWVQRLAIPTEWYSKPCGSPGSVSGESTDPFKWKLGLQSWDNVTNASASNLPNFKAFGLSSWFKMPARLLNDEWKVDGTKTASGRFPFCYLGNLTSADVSKSLMKWERNPRQGIRSLPLWRRR